MAFPIGWLTRPMKCTVDELYQPIKTRPRPWRPNKRRISSFTLCRFSHYLRSIPSGGKFRSEAVLKEVPAFPAPKNALYVQNRRPEDIERFWATGRVK